MAISADLFSTLKDEILTGKLISGQKMTEQVICDKYSISRTPVREALQKLEMEGLVQSVPNRGFFVLGLTAQDYKDMFTLRKIYEVQAVRWAIERITSSELSQLEETFEFMEFYTMKKDVAKMLTINMNFHQMIYSASKNRMLKNLLSSYQELLKHVESNAPKDGAYLADVFKEHQLIFEAFKTGDVEAGCKAMDSHMTNSEKRYQNSL